MQHSKLEITFMFQKWMNPFLAWEKAGHGNIESISVDPSEVWIPDVGLVNK